jgi:hypothetical protein
VSLSRTPCQTGIFGLERAVIHTLDAWDPVLQSEVALQPGMILRSCRIVRFARLSTYYMEFEVDGRTFQCPLHGFQPRTESREPVGIAPGVSAGERILFRSR